MSESRTKKLYSFFPKELSVGQSKDSGMALVLVLLLIGYFMQVDGTVAIAILLLLANMIYPKIYRPFARVWIGMSNLIGTIMSKVILTLIFFLMVVPIGKLRSLLKIDSLVLKKWKQGTDSVFEHRDHTYGPDDLAKPY